MYLSGDTRYRSIMDGVDEEEQPVCQAFKEINDRFGEFDMTIIPINNKGNSYT